MSQGDEIASQKPTWSKFHKSVLNKNIQYFLGAPVLLFTMTTEKVDVFLLSFYLQT